MLRNAGSNVRTTMGNATSACAIGMSSGKGKPLQAGCRKATKKPKPSVTALAPKGSMKNGSRMRLTFQGWLSAYAPSKPKTIAITTVRAA